MIEERKDHKIDSPEERARRVLARLAEMGLQGEIAAAAALYHVTPELIVGRDRGTSVVMARHAVWASIRERHHKSYPEIGRLFEVDHRSIMHGVARHTRREELAA